MPREAARAGTAEIGRLFAGAPTTTPLNLSLYPFSSFDRLKALRHDRRPNPNVTIGGRTYREVDNGRANVLVPVENPLFTPAEQAARRRAIERAFFMAEHPFGAIAYGAATLANAPPQARESALRTGGLLDTMALGASRGGPPRRAIVPPRAQPAPPVTEQLEIRPGEQNADGQPMGVTATITKPMLGTGSRARRNPVGWQGNGRIFNEARAHLLAKWLGGSGADMRNVVTMTHRGANTPQMSNFERGVAERVRAGEVVEYSATPLYTKGVLPPSAVLVTASGTRGAPTARLIQNPAGRRK